MSEWHTGSRGATMFAGQSTADKAAPVVSMMLAQQCSRTRSMPPLLTLSHSSGDPLIEARHGHPDSHPGTEAQTGQHDKHHAPSPHATPSAPPHAPPSLSHQQCLPLHAHRKLGIRGGFAGGEGWTLISAIGAASSLSWGRFRELVLFISWRCWFASRAFASTNPSPRVQHDNLMQRARVFRVAELSVHSLSPN